MHSEGREPRRDTSLTEPVATKQACCVLLCAFVACCTQLSEYILHEAAVTEPTEY